MENPAVAPEEDEAAMESGGEEGEEGDGK